MRGRGERREAGFRDRRTAILRGEEGGASMVWREGNSLSKEKWRQRRRGGVPLPATGAPQTAARQCQKERDKATDAQSAIRSVLQPRQQRMV